MLGVVAVVFLGSIATTGMFAAGIASGNTGAGDAYFDVTITGTNGPVVADDTLVVDATVTNTGNATDSQQIHLKDSAGEIVDSIAGPPLTLSPGESDQVELRWDTETGDENHGEISVQSNDDYPWTNVTITDSDDESDDGPTPEPEFEASVTSTNPVTAVVNETVAIEATVENVGSAQGEYVASLSHNGTVLDERTLDVPARTATNVTLNHTFEQPGLYELTTETEATVTVDVVLPMNATIQPVIRDDGATVTATIAHAQPNSTITIPLANASLGSPGNVTFLTQSLQLGTETATTDVFELRTHATETPPDGVESLPEHVQEITYLETASTDNGSLENTTFEFVASTNHTTVYQYDSNASAWRQAPATARNETADGTLWRATTERNATVAIGVRQPAFAVSDLALDDQVVTDGSTVTATATVTNVGAAPGQYNLDVTADGVTLDSQAVSLDANENATVRLSFTPDGPGEYEIALDNATSTTLTVEEASTPTSTPEPTTETATDTPTNTATETPPTTSESEPATQTVTETATGTAPTTASGPGFTAIGTLVVLVLSTLTLVRRHLY